MVSLPMLHGPDRVQWDVFDEAFQDLAAVTYPRGGRPGAMCIALPPAEYEREYGRPPVRYKQPADATTAQGEREEEHETRRASRAKSPGRREGATRNERARRGAKGDADHDDSRSRETPVPTRAAGEAPEAPR